ncbi:MAG: DUF4349 domain-containing protein [Erysipelotrichaceae bacterium]|nr:DUF4349 domain-containing protein [Erysipelotrichaceae bacterium]
MKNEKLVDAIGLIDDHYIEEAHKANRKQFRFSWAFAGKLAAGFACLCLLITIAPKILNKGAGFGNKAAEDTYYYNGGSNSTGNTSYKTSIPSSSYYGDYDADVMVEDAAYMSDESYSGGSTSRNESSSGSSTELQANKKLIVTGDLNMETMDLDKVLDQLGKNVNECGGYFQDSSVSTSGSYRYYTAVIRIPAEKYADFISTVQGSGNVTYYHENTRDITDAYTDLSARLTSLKAEEEKVLEFYKQAESIDDLMRIESRLTDIRYEIDYIENQLKNFDLQVSYSTLTISIKETTTYTETSVSFWERLANSFRYGWTDFISGVEDFVLGVIYYIWTILLLAAIAFGGYKLYKKLRNRRNK